MKIKISKLKPTEARLLIDPYKLKGRELIISAISELVFFQLLKLTERKVDSIVYQIVELGILPEKESLIGYHQILIECVKEHYKFYPEPNDIHSTLTSDRLLRDVYGKIKFNYFRFKTKFIIRGLRDKGLFKNTFPFYYFRSIRTKDGKKTEKRLIHLIDELEKYYLYYKEHHPDKLKEILKELGPNILLAYNIQNISRHLRIWKNEGFIDSSFLCMYDPLIFDSLSNLELPDMELPDFNFPGFDWSDSGFELPTFGND